MCGGSKSTAPPPPSPPTTFGYGVQPDASNTQKRAAQLQSSTMAQTNPAAMTPTDEMTKATGTSTLGGA